MLLRGALLLGLCCALLQGCELALLGAGGAAAMTAMEDRRTAGTQIEDEGIELRIGNRIGERFGDKAHVNVTSYNRWVLLTGEVADEASRGQLEKIAQAVGNVRGTSNEVQVAGISSLGARANDSYITSKVKARFVDARRFSPVHVKVVTEAGVVYLMGVVTQKEADDAVEIARTTDGVRKVVKIFEYCQATDEACRPRAKQPAEAPKQPS
ncbi:MAG TPA: BON domain-containing protein [Burkholderiales bacterium]|jgi:osmotically-inducible protein OsmY|nr:BON domain-containing protein [Burkholderiales bacterium]